MPNEFRKFVPYLNRPKCFFDVETTGVVPGHHEITELGFLHDTLGEWSVRVKPKFMERAEPIALQVSRYRESDWASAPPIEEVWGRVLEFLEDTIIVGHNVGFFDLPMLEGEARMKGLNYERVSRAYEDTQCLALSLLIPKGDLKRVSLNALCKHFGISNEGEHHALEDVRRTKAVYYKMVKGQQSLF